MPQQSISFADYSSIIALRVTFGDALDRRRFGDLDDVFTAEIDVDLSALGIPAGRMPRADLVALFRHAFRHEKVATFQAYSNFSVTVDGDQAAMTSLLHGHHTGVGIDGGTVFDLRARYHDRLERTPDGWRISGFVLDVIAMSGNGALIS